MHGSHPLQFSRPQFSQALFWLQMAIARLRPRSVWAIYQANITTLESLISLPKTDCMALGLSRQDYTKLHAQWNNTNQTQEHQTVLDKIADWYEADQDAHLIYPTHPHYPPQLREIADAPYLLYAKGKSALLISPQLAIIGARTPSPTGAEDAFRFARTLVEDGITVTSGMAYGIDTAAHTGALHTGATIAVLGTGIDIIYPASNAKLAHQIAEQGLLLSEFALGSRPLARHFPERNRIISGLSMGVFVIEAGLKSGSLITARLALEQNKDVFALPGSIHNPMARGCHHLLKQGAILVESVADIYEHITYYPIEQNSQHTNMKSKVNNEVVASLTPIQAKLLSHIDTNPVELDTLVVRTKIPITELTPLLFELEMLNLVRREQDRYAQQA